MTDLTNLVFGKLTVLRPDGHKTWKNKQKVLQWRCLCECGQEKSIHHYSLLKGVSRSCGCLRTTSQKTGSQSHKWKSGKTINKDGYVYLNRAPSKTYKEGLVQKRVFEHIAVMVEHIGRPLNADETVHHKNGIRHDNRIENLELKSSSHGPGQRVEDLVTWAKEILSRYCPEALR